MDITLSEQIEKLSADLVAAQGLVNESNEKFQSLSADNETLKASINSINEEKIKLEASLVEREAQIKDKAGLVIVIMALFMAITVYFSNMHSGAGLKNMLKATDTYSFYQSKSIKQTIAEGQRDDYLARGDKIKAAKLEAKIQRYETDPVTNEGKRELLAKAQAYEKARDDAAKHSPWLTFASMAFQLAIVLLSASILAVNNKMYKISEVVAVLGVVLLSQGIWLWLPV